MQQLLVFIYNNRAFFTFVGLQLLAAWLIVNKNTYQSFAFLSSSSQVMGNLSDASGSVGDYFELKNQNTKLMRENALLLQQTNNSGGVASKPDSYRFIPAQVVNNSVRFNNNYLTIDKGLADGIAPGMGVITDKGIVGKVKACSENFSTVYSLLHSSLEISSEIKRDGSLCTTKWKATENDYTQASLLHLARHKQINQGDTVVTAGSNAIFPPAILIGTVNSVSREGIGRTLSVQIDLSTEFSQLDYVYIIRNKYAAERDSLEQSTILDRRK